MVISNISDLDILYYHIASALNIWVVGKIGVPFSVLNILFRVPPKRDPDFDKIPHMRWVQVQGHGGVGLSDTEGVLRNIF